MSDSLFLPRELFTTSMPNPSSVPAQPSQAVLNDLRRIATPVVIAATSNAGGQKNRRHRPRDPNAPKVDLWLDLAT